jgi:hypothetical protein
VTPDEIILGLTQGEITTIVAVAVGAFLLLLLLSALLRLGAALMRVGCLVIAIGVFIFTLTRMFN